MCVGGGGGGGAFSLGFVMLVFLFFPVRQASTWSRGHKTFFLLNSTKHEIATALKKQNAEKH